jgi:hypothetical protein
VETEAVVPRVARNLRIEGDFRNSQGEKTPGRPNHRKLLIHNILIDAGGEGRESNPFDRISATG